MASWLRIWRQVTEPLPAVTDAEQRRQSRLLATLLLVLMAGGALSLLAQLAIIPGNALSVALLVTALILLLPAYWLARQGRYQAGAGITAATTTVACLGVIVINPADQVVYSYLLVPVILASVFLAWRPAVMAIISIVALTVVVTLVRIGARPDVVVGPELLALVVLASLTMLAAWQRNRVEDDRQSRLRQSEENLRSLASNANDGIVVIVGNRAVFANQRAAELLGYSVDEFLSRPVQELVPPGERARISAWLQECVAGREAGAGEATLLARDGNPVVVELTAARTAWQDQVAALLSVRDVRQRRRAEQQMRKLSHAIEQAADAVMITDRKGIIEYVNPAFEDVTGFSATEALGKKPSILNSGRQDSEFYQDLWRTILAGGVFTDVFINKRKDGALYYEEKTITPLKDDSGRVTHFVSTGRDISERMAAQERLQYLAQHDVLTGLPNRALFLDRLQQALARARWHDRGVAVMFIDLDRFKHINDSLGHHIGDRLLIELGGRLEYNLRDGDTVAHFGGDEFVILLTDLASEHDIPPIARKTLGTLEHPFVIDGRELYVTGSIGISLYPNDGADPNTLLKNADAAMYRAKDTGKNNFQFYSAELSAKAFERLDVETRLRRALDRGEFLLHYQPIVDLERGRISGVEALLRWQHPDLGLVAPADFIPVLEETGLIVPVGEWVLHTACSQARRWQGPGIEWPLRMAVNLSGRQFRDGSLVRSVDQVLKDTGMNPKSLELEITESVLMHSHDGSEEVLDLLHARGVRLAIDDFGTGYSSLSYLKRFPLHALKIDRSFVRDVATDAEDASIVRATIAMARSLRLDVVAEGLEGPEQLKVVRDAGCQEAQGYYFAHPQPADQVVWDRAVTN
jgi:diguanylate cyclase (GGDEF)-like protein/PAS domain S-box-containing protein